MDTYITSEDQEGDMSNKIDTIHGTSLNTILYGPPGTGKTFKTLNYALSIIENSNINEITGARSSEFLTNSIGIVSTAL